MEKLAVVVDTNVVFAALLRDGGVNRLVLTLFPPIFPFYFPRQLKVEILKHIKELAIRSGVAETHVIIALRELLSGLNLAPTRLFAHLKNEVLDLVRDPEDWAYAALALHLRKKYEHVLILTWNTKHFVTNALEEKGIIVATPPEFLTALRLKYRRESVVDEKKIGGAVIKIYHVLISLVGEE